jgi:divalent metal cation (Fe/Co/Zn/Cd) transporter
MNGHAVVSIASTGTWHRQAVLLEYFTISWNALEALVAITAGYLAGSIALVGFGLDSVIETVSGAALLWRLRQRGAGETEAEERASRIVGTTFFVLAAYVTYESLSDLWFRARPRASLAGLILAAAPLPRMEWRVMFAHTFRSAYCWGWG